MSGRSSRNLGWMVWGLAWAGMLAISPVSRAGSSPDARALAERIDASIVAELFSADGSQRAPRVDDELFLRRIHLDLVGENPKPDDVITFVLDPDPAKRERVIETLLADSRFGENWGSYWRDVIMYRRTEERSLLASRALQEFLVERLNANDGWHRVASAFITAQGDVRENGATGLIMAQGGKPEETVAEIARIFLGIQIQCAQCHDHPTDRWKREQFHQLAAFFPRVAARRDRTGEQRTFIVEGRDTIPRRRPMNDNRVFGTLEHQMPDLQNPGEPGQTMRPVFFVTGQKLATGATDAERRGKLAAWLTSEKNPWFATAAVNRVWSEMVGEGFYEPVDDMGPDRQASAPKTLELLRQAFVASGYDMKWLVRTIAMTQTYQLESRARRTSEQSPFAANASQRLRADQIYNNLTGLIGTPVTPRNPQARAAGAGGAYMAGNPRAIFQQSFGYDPSEPREEIIGSIPQILALMNSPRIQSAITAQPGSPLARMLRSVPSDDQMVLGLYLRILARQPTEDEKQTCVAYIRQGGSRAQAYEDLVWSLINSTEFLYRR